MASSRGDGWAGPSWRRPGIVAAAAAAEGAYPSEAEAGAEGLYVAVERCPLCNSTRRRLTCAKCVRSGDFVFFDGRDSERWVPDKTGLGWAGPWVVGLICSPVSPAGGVKRL